MSRMIPVRLDFTASIYIGDDSRTNTETKKWAASIEYEAPPEMKPIENQQVIEAVAIMIRDAWEENFTGKYMRIEFFHLDKTCVVSALMGSLPGMIYIRAAMELLDYKKIVPAQLSGNDDWLN